MKKNKPLRVAIDGHMLGDKSGGNETYYRNVLQNMVPDEGMELVLFVKEGTDVSAYEDRFEIVYFPNHRASIRNIIDIPIMCIKNHIDVLHMQYFIPFICPCPVVTTIHDICFEHFKDIFTTKEYYRQKIFVRYAAKKSKKIFAVSHFSKRDIIECYNVPEDKIMVTYNAVDGAYRLLSPEELNIEELKKKYGIEGDYILSVCNLQPRKNLKRLIEAYKKIRENYNRDIQLVIVGKKAWMYDEIFSAARETQKVLQSENGRQDIVFTDYVDEADLIRLYNGARCFVYPSYFEGFGIPPLEAMACGTPVAVSHATSLPEVVGDAGAYFDPFNTDYMAEIIDKILSEAEAENNSSQMSLRKEKIVRQTQKYSWKISSEKLKEAYWEVYNNRK